MTDRWLTFTGVAVALLMAAVTVPSAVADGATFSTLYKFEAPAVWVLNQTPCRRWVRMAPFTG
jgi:hypothetical protein